MTDPASVTPDRPDADRTVRGSSSSMNRRARCGRRLRCTERRCMRRLLRAGIRLGNGEMRLYATADAERKRLDPVSCGEQATLSLKSEVCRQPLCLADHVVEQAQAQLPEARIVDVDA